VLFLASGNTVLQDVLNFRKMCKRSKWIVDNTTISTVNSFDNFKIHLSYDISDLRDFLICPPAIIIPSLHLKLQGPSLTEEEVPSSLWERFFTYWSHRLQRLEITTHDFDTSEISSKQTCEFLHKLTQKSEKLRKIIYKVTERTDIINLQDIINCKKDDEMIQMDLYFHIISYYRPLNSEIGSDLNRLHCIEPID